LRQVLERTAPLRRSLNLRQLVPVYQAFLAVVDVDDGDDDDVISSYSSNDDAEELLRVQYALMRYQNTHPTSSSHMEQLSAIVLPRVFSSSRDVSDELLEALLDAVLLLVDDNTTSSDKDATTTTTTDDETVLLQSCLQQVHDNNNEQHWSAACRVLRRLYEWSNNNNNESQQQQQLVVSALADQVVWFLQQQETSANNSNHFYGPLTRDILPCLVQAAAEQQRPNTSLQRIWEALMWSDCSSNNNLVATTTVLCSLLPSLLLDQELSSDDNNHMTQLWDLIQNCLGQGILAAPATATVPPNLQQLVRRRGLYLLRVLVEQQSLLPMIWNKYVACLETLEMESELHLIDQVWETVTELFEQMTTTTTATTTTTPPLSWDWMQLLLGRAIAPARGARDDSSSNLTKLCLFRLLKGQAGIRVASNQRGAPLATLTVDFVCRLLIPSYDSLLTTVGTNLQATEAMANLAKSDAGGSSSSKAIVAQDMEELLAAFIGSFLEVLLTKKDSASLEAFYRWLWSKDALDKIHKKVCVRIFQTVEHTLMKQQPVDGVVPVTDEMLTTVAESINYSFVYGSVLPTNRDALLRALATMLAYSKPPLSTTETTTQYTPNSVLAVLSLFPVPLLESSSSDQDTASWIEQDPALSSLRTWLKGNEAVSKMGATVATAFVDGLMQASEISDTSTSNGANKHWDFKTGCTGWERRTAKAVSLLCILPSSDSSSTEGSAASGMLWPAIAKGLSHAPVAMIGASWTKADRVSRALLLLEIGCQLQILSGMGNGTMVIDKKTQSMMPPPPNIEAMLANSASFIFHHLRSLMTGSGDEQTGRASQSNDARVLSTTFARLVAQLETLSRGFLASMAISSTVDDVMSECLDALSAPNVATEGNPVLNVALLYAALSGGGDVDPEKALAASQVTLGLEFSGSLAKRVGNAQALRSVFQYAKWGALSCLLPRLLHCDDSAKVKSFVDDLFDEAADAVESAPANAIIPLFNCLVSGAKSRFSKEAFENGQLKIQNDIRYLGKVISALIGLVEDAATTVDTIYMMDEMCCLIFQPVLLYDEYLRLEDDSGCDTPIRDAFRRFMKMAGTQRPHMSRVVLSRICSSWLRTTGDSANEIGLSAIPYREDIAKLLIHKEERVTVLSSASVQRNNTNDSGDGERLLLLDSIDETSVSRGFLLVFLSKLPDIDNGLSPRVIKELQFVSKKLLDKIPPTGKGVIMHGVSLLCFGGPMCL